jgi:hypothetical protein
MGMFIAFLGLATVFGLVASWLDREATSVSALEPDERSTHTVTPQVPPD